MKRYFCDCCGKEAETFDIFFEGFKREFCVKCNKEKVNRMKNILIEVKSKGVN